MAESMKQKIETLASKNADIKVHPYLSILNIKINLSKYLVIHGEIHISFCD